MWNPLSLPFGVLATLTRGIAALERAVAQAELLNERGDLILAELAEARDVFAEAMVKVDRLGDQGDRVLEEIAAGRKLVAQLMRGGDDLVAAGERMREQAEEAIAAIDAARPTADRLADSAPAMIDAAVAARRQLVDTQAELSRANEQITRALDLAQPLESMTARVERLTSGLRRDRGESDDG